MLTRFGTAVSLHTKLATLLLLGACSAQARAGQICDGLREQLLEQSAHRTVVQLTWDDASPSAAVHSVAVAVPTAATPSLRVLSHDAVPSAEPSEFEGPISVSPPRRFRQQWLAHVLVPVTFSRDARSYRTRSLVFALEHPGDPPPLRSGDVAAAYEGLAVNAVAWPHDALAAQSGGVPIVDVFEQSPRWLRIEIVESGIHQLTFDDLATVLGSFTAAEMIQPDSFRLFSSPTPAQPALPSDKNGSWKQDYSLVERSLFVEAAGPLLAPSDRLLFFAPGPEDWADRYDPTAAPLDHFEHEFADRLAYWLTWDEVGPPPGSFAEPPRRMLVLDGSITGTAAERDYHRHRSHHERNDVEFYGGSVDNWVWQRRIDAAVSIDFDFEVRDLLPGPNTRLLTHGIGRQRRTNSDVMRQRIAFNGGIGATFVWRISEQRNVASAPLELTADSFALQEGANVLTVTNESGTDNNGLANEIIFDFFTLTYDRALKAMGTSFSWVIFEDEVRNSALWDFQVDSSGPPWQSPLVFDLTDPHHPVAITGGTVSGSRLSFETFMTAGAIRHFNVVEDGAMQHPALVTPHRPRLLRSEVRGDPDVGYDLVVIHPPSLAAAAQTLADHRSTELTGHPDPNVTTVALPDVYDQFGHGVKEPAAIRNYLKFLFEVDPRLEYAVLLGDASRDYRNRLGRDESGSEIDRCPTHIQTHWPFDPTLSGTVPYAADDWFGSFDDPPTSSPNSIAIDLPDIAIGRLPAANLGEATHLVQRIVDYDLRPAPGTWRNLVTLVADDEFAAVQPLALESKHIDEAECIDDFLLPPELDVDKIYLTEFTHVPGGRAKPAARETMRQSWSRGALVMHYIGHGSPEQLADEAVFRIEDIPSLQNGDRLPLFLAFSCDVAIFDSPTTKSMTEQLLLAPSGGAIAGIAATQVTFPSPNEDLTEAFYPRLYPSGGSGQSIPLGRALIQAKAAVPFVSSAFTRHNNQKYVILGDPSLRLQSPLRWVEMDGDIAASVQSARRQSVEGRIEDDGAVLTVDGTYHLRVTESADSTRYVVERDSGEDFVLPYVLDGGTFYLGSGSFSDGAMQAELISPALMRFGQDGRARLLMESGSKSYVGVLDPLPVTQVPILDPDSTGPDLSLAFADNARRVSPGAILRARLSDESGINVLGTNPANSLRLEFDADGIPVDVTRSFELDEGTFTAGGLEYSLPESIEPGEHRVVLTASDMHGNASSAELAFEVTAPGEVAIADHAVVPSPFRDSTSFVVEVASPLQVSSDVQITIHTAQGQAVQRLTAPGVRGAVVIPWDGRDQRGDEIANGVYVYVVRATFDTDPPLVHRSVGKVVRMR